MPVFFIQSSAIQDNTLSIHEPLFSHLHKSLRIRQGHILRVGDERRQRYVIRIARIGDRHLVGTILERQTGPPPLAHNLVLGQAILKGQRMSWIIQKATELGVSVIVPLISARVVVRPKMNHLLAYQERWQHIAEEAAQQSERWEIPKVVLPRTTTEFWKEYRVSCLSSILIERENKEGITSLRLPNDPLGRIVLTVGPEGGWTQEELDEAQNNNFQPITLGPHILRGETAALAALSILQSRLGYLR